MDVCYMCGSPTASCEVQVTPNPSAPHEPYFPFLLYYERPSGAKPPSATGGVRTCVQCRHQLVASWRQSNSTDEASAQVQQLLLQQQFYMSMLRSAGMTGGSGGAGADFQAQSSAYSPEVLMRLAQQQHHQQQQQQQQQQHHHHQQHHQQQQKQQQATARSAANSSAGSSSRASPSVAGGGGVQQIRCYLCRRSMAKLDAKIVYARPVSDNCEHFPFLSQLTPPPEALPLTQGATKLCLQCHSALVEQYRQYETSKKPQDSRVYRVVCDGGQTKFFCNSGTPNLSCPLCGDPFKDTPIWLPWKPTGGATGGSNSNSTPFYPLLSKVSCENAHLLIDRQHGCIMACRACCDYLHQQWNQQERLPPQSRQYQLRRTPPPALQSSPAAAANSGPVRPMIAQCHVCLCALHNPETLKLLRHKPKSGRPGSPYFPFLANLRPNSQSSANGTFPVCDLCYTNLRWQWIHRTGSGGGGASAAVDAASAVYHIEYICSGCLQLKASNEEVRLQGDCLLCLDCSGVAAGGSGGSSSGGGGRSGGGAIGSASGGSGGRERVTVTVPPITRSSETRPAMASAPITSAGPPHSQHHHPAGASGGGYSDALRSIAAKNAAAAAAAGPSSAMDDPSMALGTLPPPGWLNPDQLSAYYSQMLGYQQLSYQYQMLQALAAAYPPYASDPASLAMLYGYHPQQQQHRGGPPLPPGPSSAASGLYPSFNAGGSAGSASSSSSAQAAAAAAAAMMMMDPSAMMPGGFYANSAMGSAAGSLMGHQHHQQQQQQSQQPARPGGSKSAAAPPSTTLVSAAGTAKPPTPAKPQTPTRGPPAGSLPSIPSSPKAPKLSQPGSTAGAAASGAQHEDALDLSRKPSLPTPVIKPPFSSPAAAVATRPAAAPPAVHKMFRPFEDSDDDAKPTPPPAPPPARTAQQQQQQQSIKRSALSPKPPTLSPQQSRVDGAYPVPSDANNQLDNNAALARADTDSSEEGRESPVHTPDVLRKNLKEKSNFLRKFHLRPLSHAQKLCHRQTRQLVRKYLRRIRQRSKVASRLATSRILRRLEDETKHLDGEAAIDDNVAEPGGNGECDVDVDDQSPSARSPDNLGTAVDVEMSV